MLGVMVTVFCLSYFIALAAPRQLIPSDLRRRAQYYHKTHLTDGEPVAEVQGSTTAAEESLRARRLSGKREPSLRFTFSQETILWRGVFPARPLSGGLCRFLGLHLVNAEEPERLRGPQDDAAVWMNWVPETWDTLQFGKHQPHRMGENRHRRISVASRRPHRGGAQQRRRYG